jgi:hypothetical protein
MGKRGTEHHQDRYYGQQHHGQQRGRRGIATYEDSYETVEYEPAYPQSHYPSGYPGEYADQYSGQYPGVSGQQTGYHTAVRQTLAQARAEMATRYAETATYDPAQSGTHQGSRKHRAWHDGDLSGASDVSLPRIRVAPEPGGYAGPTNAPPAPRRGTRRSPQHPGAGMTGATQVVDAYPDAYPGGLTQDPYGETIAAQPSAKWQTMARQPATAAPVTREQRTVVIEHPWGEPFDADESGVREFSRELDALISMTTAQQRVVLPKAQPADKRAAKRFGVLATFGVRVGVAFLILLGIMSGITALTGHAPLPNLALPAFGSTEAGAIAQFGVDFNLLTRIQPLTQLKRADQYDNTAQFNAWGGAACSAAVLAETLTAYGVPHATIGHMIDELGGNISQQWGLVSYNGFAQVAAKHGLRADMYVDHPLTYAQMLYLTNTLHVPLIVNVRATSGYYHYLDGGHFLVMTGGDAQTVRLVDSSEYYIKSLPYNTFMGMYRNRSVAIVPQDFHYTLP